jgi:hypothetical protein
MFFADLLFALVLGLLVTVIFAGGFGCARAWDDLILFFLVIFLGGWAASVWVATGPILFDVYWLPTLITGLLIAMLFMALVPPYSEAARRPMNRIEAAKAEVAEHQALEASQSVFLDNAWRTVSRRDSGLPRVTY